MAKVKLPKKDASEEVKQEEGTAVDFNLTPDQEAAQPVKEETPKTAELKRIIESYKKANPAKYELKKEELEQKLAASKK